VGRKGECPCSKKKTLPQKGKENGLWVFELSCGPESTEEETMRPKSQPRLGQFRLLLEREKKRYESKASLITLPRQSGGKAFLGDFFY